MVKEYWPTVNYVLVSYKYAVGYGITIADVELASRQKDSRNTWVPVRRATWKGIYCTAVLLELKE
jgi:hypothetical protein